MATTVSALAWPAATEPDTVVEEDGVADATDAAAAAAAAGNVEVADPGTGAADDGVPDPVAGAVAVATAVAAAVTDAAADDDTVTGMDSEGVNKFATDSSGRIEVDCRAASCVQSADADD
eukprot:g837.t1